jgi:hypothetical protein
MEGQSAILQRALDALNSICQAAPAVAPATIPAQPSRDVYRIPARDPAAWKEDFDRWRAENCAYREGRDDWGGIGCLWVAFCEWAVKHDSVHCERQTFERLLADDGYRCVEGMVAGLVLKVDLEAAAGKGAQVRHQSGCALAKLQSAQAALREAWPEMFSQGNRSQEEKQ